MEPGPAPPTARETVTATHVLLSRHHSRRMRGCSGRRRQWAPAAITQVERGYTSATKPRLHVDLPKWCLVRDACREDSSTVAAAEHTAAIDVLGATGRRQERTFDALMADYDGEGETGAAMPLLTHTHYGLARHVREEVASWSSTDKRDEYTYTPSHRHLAALCYFRHMERQGRK